jgi:hypothetical protein
MKAIIKDHAIDDLKKDLPQEDQDAIEAIRGVSIQVNEYTATPLGIDPSGNTVELEFEDKNGYGHWVYVHRNDVDFVEEWV